MTFKFTIGGYHSGNFEVVLKNKQLQIFDNEYAVMQAIPTLTFSIVQDIDWEKMVTFLLSSQWNAVYSNDIMDGTQWTLDFKHLDKK